MTFSVLWNVYIILSTTTKVSTVRSGICKMTSRFRRLFLRRTEIFFPFLEDRSSVVGLTKVVRLYGDCLLPGVGTAYTFLGFMLNIKDCERMFRKSLTSSDSASGRHDDRWSCQCLCSQGWSLLLLDLSEKRKNVNKIFDYEYLMGIGVCPFPWPKEPCAA